jgi:hypothetical protein
MKDFRVTRRHQWTCGRHSGIPRCCVLFFIWLWFPLWDWKPFRKPWGAWLCRRYRAWTLFKRNGSNCTRCPLCLWLRRPAVSTLHCNCYDQFRQVKEA